MPFDYVFAVRLEEPPNIHVLSNKQNVQRTHFEYTQDHWYRKQSNAKCISNSDDTVYYWNWPADNFGHTELEIDYPYTCILI